MAGLILGIETSCDDTAAAVVSADLRVHANVVSRQLEAHDRYGGVVPELASRIHTSEIMPVVARALDEAGVAGPDLSAIAVTRGPGLAGSLLVGISAAKALSLAWGIPLIPVNHLDAHLASAHLGDEPVAFPCLVLLVSGGHTMLARMDGPTALSVLGRTRDDSAGEAFDKVARMMDLGYPGGPVIDRLGATGTPCIDLPRPMLHSPDLDVSFSGLKTAVARHLRAEPDTAVPDLCASFTAALMDVLDKKLRKALKAGDYQSISVVGGVAANRVLRARLAALSASRGVRICMPPRGLEMDNGAMIAAAAWLAGGPEAAGGLRFGAAPNLALGAPA